MEIRELHSSAKVRALYARALAKLLEELNETWIRIFPLKAWFPQETCEAFFPSFASFGVAIYDAYAEELLNWNLPEDRYLQALNFDLKTLVCNRISPHREKPVRTFRDAMDADARGEPLDEWTLRVGESWRLFEHPRHSVNRDRVSREFIDLYGHMPHLWDRLISFVHNSISRRSAYWLAQHADRGLLALVGAEDRRAPWVRIRSQFLKGAGDYPDVTAHWDSRQAQWELRSEHTNASACSDAEKLFKDTARLAIAALGIPSVEGPPWHKWLDLMRKQQRGFRRILRPRNWRQFRTIVEADGNIDTSEVLLGEDGVIFGVFAQSSEFTEDLEATVDVRKKNSSRASVEATLASKLLVLVKMPPGIRERALAVYANRAVPEGSENERSEFRRYWRERIDREGQKIEERERERRLEARESQQRVRQAILGEPEARRQFPSADQTATLEKGGEERIFAKSGLTGEKARFPNRASWLAQRLHERSWNKHDVKRNNGPDHKTVQKILDGRHVREDTLLNLAQALSATPPKLKLPPVALADIPTD